MANLNSRRWTGDDIATLKNLARKYPAAAIARQLGRSAAATAFKSSRTETLIENSGTKGGSSAGG
jgi:hypothetical protein